MRSNPESNSGSYTDDILMDTYTGGDVPYVTRIGVTKTSTPEAYISSGPKGNGTLSTWKTRRLACADELTWNSISGKPSSFTPSSHTHAWSQITSIPSYATRWPTWAEVTGKPSSFTPASHNHSSIVLTDSRSTNYTPYNTELVKGITGTHLKQNTVDGLSDGGTYHSSIYIHPWNDSSGGAAHNLAFTDNGNMWLRSGTSTWNSWKRIAMLSVAQTWTAYQDFTSGAGNSGSDMRFKIKLSDSIGNILDELLDIEIFPYIWNKEGEQKRNTFGVNATQLKTKQGIFEKIVHEREDEEKTEWVEYNRIGVLALKGLQEEVIQRREENKKLTKVLEVICEKIGIDMNKILEEI